MNTKITNMENFYNLLEINKITNYYGKNPTEYILTQNKNYSIGD